MLAVRKSLFFFLYKNCLFFFYLLSFFLFLLFIYFLFIYNKNNSTVMSSFRSCYKCGEPGHQARECQKTESVCYNCQQEGHLSKDW
ncbi:uncharacterized protein BX664DRAFT_133570 [Halteromyces radiatus]|uniref:uncharacterized protein n=1 Tax=Halteromyces radiatus TaxID=101107 RepID=UPI00221FAE02|nr:uncharacterized protein BX664DRAFT_133570 [Halteromyces radiatus]KAI8089404.1 hypothetical protein BX664DRAFT_133570 [Halteromyces radiatus]